ncbi:MAG: 3-oxoacyl-ACP reductase family protein [Candidatus Omnitrophota bacterium]
MRIDLKDKVAIITGGAAGIGKACAKLMLENSALVIIADINTEEGKKTITELSALGSCEFIRTDVSDQKSVGNLVEDVVNKYKRIDIIVNNAGININKAEDRVNIDQFVFEDWKNILDVDLNGVFYCSKAVSKVMIKQKSGRIINIGSVFGNVPARKQIAYVAAKAGVHNMTRAMALELAPYGINVNAVAPGSTLTEGTRMLFYGDDAAQAEVAERMLSHIPLGRPGEPEDIANAVLFLSGEESNYITGHVLTVDGGWTCGYTRDF